MTSRPRLISISTKQARIATLAKQIQGTAITSLSHHMDLEWLREAFRRTRKDGAVGVDGQTADDYAENLEGNLQSLLDRVKSGTYRAPPVRRVHIPKGDGSETRPIGIPTFEDKLLQRAVVMLLEPVYEQEFYDFSYGFRPRRSAHDALEALDRGLRDMGGGWVLDVDIRSFFDTLDKGKLRDLLRLRVVDGVVVRLVGKWLRAGVLEDGVVRHPATGTPHPTLKLRRGSGQLGPVISRGCPRRSPETLGTRHMFLSLCFRVPKCRMHRHVSAHDQAAEQGRFRRRLPPTRRERLGSRTRLCRRQGHLQLRTLRRGPDG